MKKRKNIYLIDKIARKASFRRAILSYKKYFSVYGIRHFTTLREAIDRKTGNVIEDKIDFIIEVGDTNDNRPEFGKNSYVVKVKEHSKFGTELELETDEDFKYIFATDLDKSKRSEQKAELESIREMMNKKVWIKYIIKMSP